VPVYGGDFSHQIDALCFDEDPRMRNITPKGDDEDGYDAQNCRQKQDRFRAQNVVSIRRQSKKEERNSAF
jgi:hypothetical protein